MTAIGVIARPELAPEELLDAAVAVEDAGVEELWLWEDCFLAGGVATSAAVLARTSALVVGLGLMPAPLRNPALAAMEVGALARLAAGRFLPATGHGVLSWMEQVGARAASPMGLLEEHTAAVRALLHGEEVTADGEHVRLAAVRLDHPPAAAPPLLVGARGPKTLRLAGRVADGVVLDVHDGGPTPATVADALTAVREGRATSVVHAPGAPLHVVVFVEPDEDPAGQALGLAAAGATSVVFQPSASSPGPGSVLPAALAAQRALAAAG